MNCPICGTPLGDGDAFCSNCGTKRAEMGAAYNNTQPSQNYGGMARNGYGNANNYGNTNAYQNGYGNTNAYQNGYGMNNTMAPVRTSGTKMGPKNILVLAIAAIMVVFCVFGYSSYINTPQKVNMADITVTLPQRMSKQSSSVFADSDADGGEFYMNRKVGFAYLKYSVGELGLDEGDLDGLENLFIRIMTETFENSLEGYEKKDQLGDLLRFYFTESGHQFFSDMKIEVHGNEIYMFVVYCKRADEDKFQSKFTTMYNTIEFNR